MDTAPHGFTLAPQDGQPLELASWHMLVKVPAQATGGAFTVLHGRMESRLDGPPAHIHDRHDEAFYVLSGRLRFRLGDNEHEVTAGGMAFASRGLVHGFANPADEPALYLAVISPSGYELYFREVESHLERFGAIPDREHMARLMARYATRLA
jgi:mannose-6-phosphate isomerase-like protein (cupin superfamily)